MTERISDQQRVATWGEATQIVSSAWIVSGHHLLRIEGFRQVGKTTLSNRLFRLLGARQLSTDLFAINRTGKGQTYLEMLDLHRLRQRAGELMADGAGQLTMFEGVCLEQTLPSTEFGRGFRVYIKRASNATDLWHDFYEDLSEENNRFRNSILEYHKQFTPDRVADLVIAVPEGCD